MEKLKEKLSAFSDTTDIYKLEKYLMGKIEMWPGANLINKKLISLYLSTILLITVPQAIFLCRNSFFESMFAYSHGLVEFLYILNFEVCFLIFMWKRREFKQLLEDFEECWKSCKFPWCMWYPIKKYSNLVLSENMPEILDFHYKLLRTITIVMSASTLFSILGCLSYSTVPILIDCVHYFLLNEEDVEWSFALNFE